MIATAVLLATVPIAAPIVPMMGINVRLNTTVSAVMMTPSRSGVRESPAARNAPLSMKNSIMPMMPASMVRKKGSASFCTSGAALTSRSSEGAANHPIAPMISDMPAAVRNA